MIEFYITYELDGRHFLAIVLAPERPASLKFPSRDEFVAAMEGLGNAWQLKAELDRNLSAEALEELAKGAAFRSPPKQHDSIFSFGTIPSAPSP